MHPTRIFPRSTLFQLDIPGQRSVLNFTKAHFLLSCFFRPSSGVHYSPRSQSIHPIPAYALAFKITSDRSHVRHRPRGGRFSERCRASQAEPRAAAILPTCRFLHPSATLHQPPPLPMNPLHHMLTPGRGGAGAEFVAIVTTLGFERSLEKQGIFPRSSPHLLQRVECSLANVLQQTSARRRREGG